VSCSTANNKRSKQSNASNPCQPSNALHCIALWYVALHCIALHWIHPPTTSERCFRENKRMKRWRMLGR